MLESKLVFFIIYVIGIVGEAGWSFPFSGRKAVSANPIHNYRYQPQFYRNPMWSGYHQNYGARALHSNLRHQHILGRRQPSQYIPMNYDVFFYKKDNIRSDVLFSILNILSNQELGKSSKKSRPSLIIRDGNINNNSHSRPAAEQSILNFKNVTVQLSPQRVMKIRGQEDFPTQDQASGYSTTEPTAILGMPLVVPMSDVNSEGMDSSIRLEILMEKQCVQDCQSSTSYSPVCGSDNVTYFNKEKFLCAQQCGVDVIVTKSGPCN